MIRFLFLLPLFISSYAQVPGYFSIEPSNYQALSQSQLTCLWNTPIKMPNDSNSASPIIFATRVSKADGSIDTQGINTLAIGQDLIENDGFALVGLYPLIIPNPSGSPTEQVMNIVSAVQNAGIAFTTFDDTFYIVVEPGSWSSNKTANQEFLIEMCTEIYNYVNFFGIYTNEKYWDAVLGADFDAKKLNNNVPPPDFLWWEKINGNPEFDGFVRFGGWPAPWTHKYIRNQQFCGTSVDLSWRQFTNNEKRDQFLNRKSQKKIRNTKNRKNSKN